MRPSVRGYFSRKYACDPDCPVQTPNRASGPKWEKNGRKMDFGPTRKKGKKRPKNGKIGTKMGQKWSFSQFSPFFPLFPGGAKIHFSATFFPFFPAGGPIWGLYRAIGIAKLCPSSTEMGARRSSLQASPEGSSKALRSLAAGVEALVACWVEGCYEWGLFLEGTEPPLTSRSICILATFSPVRQGLFPCSTALFLKNSHRAGSVLQEFGLVLRAGVWHSTSVVQTPPWG